MPDGFVQGLKTLQEELKDNSVLMIPLHVVLEDTSVLMKCLKTPLSLNDATTGSATLNVL